MKSSSPRSAPSSPLAPCSAGHTTSGLQGRYGAQAGLARLLAGSGLNWTETRPGVLVLRRDQSASQVESTTELDDVVVTGTLLKTSGELASPVLNAVKWGGHHAR